VSALALVGYGKMAHAVEEAATTKGIEIVARFTREQPLRVDDRTRALLTGVVLVDLSVPAAVTDNVRAATQLGCHLVIGTTGWGSRLNDVRQLVERSTIGVVYGANFSIGVNVLYRLAEQAARMLATMDGYDPFIFDWHHRFKLDSPSGTALELQRRLRRCYGDRPVSITSQRAGYIPSMHAVGFDSEADTIHLEHRTRSRRGLAEGALLAATWIASRRGLHEFDQVIDDRFQATLERCTTSR
jgi:4-hydroxy-tetrahydrodipicolinate reductase